jgi:hypothetical protein
MLYNLKIQKQIDKDIKGNGFLGSSSAISLISYNNSKFGKKCMGIERYEYRVFGSWGKEQVIVG